MLPRQAAFTIVEMMVVISIITILVAMIFPSYRNARHSARTAICASNQRQLSIAVTTYGDMNRFYPVGIDHHTNNNERIWLWPSLLRKVMNGQMDVFHCPQAPAETQWKYKEAPGEPAFQGYAANEMRVRGYTHKFSIGYNVWGAWMMQNPNTGMGVYRGHSFLDSSPVNRIRVPSDMIEFADSTIEDFWSGYIGPYRVGQYPSTIHFGNANVAFVDNHVELLPPEKLRDPYDPNVNLRWNNDHRPR